MSTSPHVERENHVGSTRALICGGLRQREKKKACMKNSDEIYLFSSRENESLSSIV